MRRKMHFRKMRWCVTELGVEVIPVVMMKLR